MFSKSQLKEDNRILAEANTQLERDLDIVRKELDDFTTKMSLGRLIEVPRKLGDTVYVIMKRDLHPEYDNELIGMRSSDTIPENNIKIIAITITGYVTISSGTYIAFKEQHEDAPTYYISTTSNNLFLSMDAAVGEMYSSGSKKKYMNDPFTILKSKDFTQPPCPISSTRSSVSNYRRIPTNNIKL